MPYFVKGQFFQCVPTNAPFSSTPCVSVGSQSYVQARVDIWAVDPGQVSVLEAKLLEIGAPTPIVVSLAEPSSEPFDYIAAGEAWAFATVMVLVSYLLGKKLGVILGIVRRG